MLPTTPLEPIYIYCPTCHERKLLGAYGFCADCFSSKERFRSSSKDPMEFDADGVPLCRFCKRRVGGRRKTFCSDQCVHEYSIRSNVQYARAQVFLRDHGVCSECGLDTVALLEELTELRNTDYAEFERQWQAMVEDDWDPQRQHTLYDVDHVKPVIEGGGLCGLDGLRTLCTRCHRIETRKLRARMAAENKAKRDAEKAKKNPAWLAPTIKQAAERVAKKETNVTDSSPKLEISVSNIQPKISG